MAQVLGLVSIVWNGTKLNIEKGATFEDSGYDQKPIVTGAQVDYAQEFMAGKVSCSMRLQRGLNLATIFIAGTAELQFVCDTGQSYLVPDAFIMGRKNITAGEGGKVKIEFGFGGPAQEILNG
jgi:hypothetical protein